MTGRLERIRAIIAEQKLDALMLTGEVSRFYATGLRSSAGVALFTPEKNVFITDFRYIEAARAKLGGSFTVEMSELARKQTKIVCEYLPRAKKIGVEGDVITLRAADAWKKELAENGLKGVKLIPAGAGVHALRAVKEPRELDAMRRAQQIAEHALEEVLRGFLRPGVTERAVCAELVYRMLKGGAEKVSFDPIVVSGANGSLPHGEPSGRVIERGDFVTIDIGCVTGGYCSDMTRTVAVGEATEEMRAVYGIVLEAQKAGIAAAKAGVAGKEIDAAARAVITDAGYGAFFGHGFGHGLGLEIHEPPNASPSEERALPAGAVISAEPGIYLPGRFGVRIEDVVVLTEGGCENLTNAPKELRIL
ncbi:MAG: Xaa-Pro peptidase family protein [Oscillospiraceae bacterium]|jgi:Xaa-Pro aminopeptidase|nr:Xaa-Pro peptidase family protein [Oscillospiraceae bacterium]